MLQGTSSNKINLCANFGFFLEEISGGGVAGHEVRMLCTLFLRPVSSRGEMSACPPWLGEAY